MLLQLYSNSMLDFVLVLFLPPLGILLPFPAGISALFGHTNKRSSGLARFYALWNITSLVNVVSSLLFNPSMFICLLSAGGGKMCGSKHVFFVSP